MTLSVFVIGAGRSGTATLAQWLSAVPGGRVAHEHEPPLLAEVSDFYAGRLGRAELVAILRTTRSTTALGGARLSGEANHRLSVLLPLLAEAFPAARIVWLVRDGRQAVASMWHRKWYHPREAEERPPAVGRWVEHRLRGDATGDLSAEAWAALDAFGRCCWYWSYTHRAIERDLACVQLPSLKLRIEDLDAQQDELAAFLGITGLLPRAVPRANSATGGPFLSWREWSPRQRAVFRRECGAVMDRHYPGWEAGMSWTAAQELSAAVARGLHRAAVTLASRTRPLRKSLGLTRGKRAS
jgi:hypothetical protein